MKPSDESSDTKETEFVLCIKRSTCVDFVRHGIKPKHQSVGAIHHEKAGFNGGRGIVPFIHSLTQTLFRRLWMSSE